MTIYINIIYWYIFLIIFALFGGTTLKFFEVLPSFVVMLLIVCIYIFGWHSLEKKIPSEKIVFNNKYFLYKAQKKSFLIIALLSPFVSYYVTFFYTGKNTTEVINSLLSGASLYNDYQNYFSENSISQLSINKILPIFGSVFMKYSLLLVIISTIISKKRIVHQYVCCALTTLSYLYFSVARGTTFEVFEILMLVWFCIILSNDLNKNKFHIFNKSNVLLVLLALISLLAYEYNIASRYSFKTDISCPTEQLCIDTDSTIYNISESVAILFNKLSGYFTFGLYYISRFIVDVWAISLASFLGYLFPAQILFSEDINQKICGVLIDCGAAWKPDFLKTIDAIGLVGLAVLIFLLGRQSANLLQQLACESVGLNKSVNKILVLFFIFLFMISLPVGNFVFASSSNIVIVFLLLLNLLYRRKNDSL